MKTGRYTVSSIKNKGERSGGKMWGKGEKWKGYCSVMQFFENKVTKQQKLTHH